MERPCPLHLKRRARRLRYLVPFPVFDSLLPLTVAGYEAGLTGRTAFPRGEGRESPVTQFYRQLIELIKRRNDTDYQRRSISCFSCKQFADEVKFSELSQDIQISSGGPALLRCVTSSAVEQCRWSLTPVNSNTTVVVKQFPPTGSEARDCSLRLTHALAEQEGLWTCGARIRGKQNYTDAPPAKLSLLEPGIIES